MQSLARNPTEIIPGTTLRCLRNDKRSLMISMIFIEFSGPHSGQDKTEWLKNGTIGDDKENKLRSGRNFDLNLLGSFWKRFRQILLVNEAGTRMQCDESKVACDGTCDWRRTIPLQFRRAVCTGSKNSQISQRKISRRRKRTQTMFIHGVCCSQSTFRMQLEILTN